MKDAMRVWGASLGAIVGYGLPTLVTKLPVPLVYPRLGILTLTPIHGEPGISWYGYLVWALVGAVIGALAGRALPPWKHGWRVVWAAGALLLVVLAWHERGWLK